MRDDEVSPNVIIGIGVLLCVFGAVLAVMGYPWGALVIVGVGLAIGAGAWLRESFWPRRPATTRGRVVMIWIAAQFAWWTGLGLWDPVGAGHNQGVGLAWLVCASLIGVMLFSRRRELRRSQSGAGRAN